MAVDLKSSEEKGICKAEAATTVTEDMYIVIVGHVDHGKSTIIGRLLADTDSLPEGKLEQVKETCRRNSKPFEYAFLLDALKDERAQGITIDSARCFFKTDKRRYVIIDAPGHIEFLKNMVTGASHAEAALLVIDATEGIQENSKRHGYLLSMLGIKQIVVLINKMDLVDYSQEVYDSIVVEYRKFLGSIGVEPACFMPVSGMQGDNITLKSTNMPWYEGLTVLQILDRLKAAEVPEDKPFRMPVQGVYKFTKGGDDRRIIAGTIESGRLKVGDEVIFYPSGKKTVVKSIEAFNKPPQTTAMAGQATGFTLKDQIYVRRGEVATLANESKPQVTSRIRGNLFWLGKAPMVYGKEYLLKLGTAKVPVQLEKIVRVIDGAELSQSSEKDCVEWHDVAECILKLKKAIAFDLATEIPQMGRFVIVDEYEISGGGIIEEALGDEQSWVREKVFQRDFRWYKSDISNLKRAEKYNQKPTLILITGEKDVGKKPIAKALERQLFTDGRFVYFLGIGNVLYGVDADIKGTSNNHREEHLRRLAEVSNIILDAGVLLIVTATRLTQNEVELIKTSIGSDSVMVIWVGQSITTDIDYHIHISNFESEDEAAIEIKHYLQEAGIIFKPW